MTSITLRGLGLLAAIALSGCGGGGGGDGGGGGASGSGSKSGPSAGPSAGSGSSDSGAAQTCVDTINSLRATIGLPAYARWVDEESCADGQAQSDSGTKQAHGAFGQCMEFAQDECPGWPGPPDQMIPKCLQQMWNEGPGDDFSTHGHYINMSSTKYTMVACGFFTLPDGSVWAAQDFK